MHSFNNLVRFNIAVFEKLFCRRRSILLIFMTLQAHFIAHCRCRADVKLFMFLLSQCSLIGICSNVQNCTFRALAEMGAREEGTSRIYLCINLGHGSSTKFVNH
jgi:hypothetical protein